ncbi:hypothetical protein E3N88_12045 [Mikania micrantha]|uniref:Uncharacterized protein n=1 Tax=Mikania micrantha TaxID=192012 RepID=A0A5N6P703_9ASTR|nr:hypothetical protein E3N88_12045 [Mikania micrantha]
MGLSRYATTLGESIRGTRRKPGADTPESHRAPKTPGNILEALPFNLEVIWSHGNKEEAWEAIETTKDPISTTRRTSRSCSTSDLVI